MRPYGLMKNFKGGGKYKIDCHPPRGYCNWWEFISEPFCRSRIKQIVRKEIENELNENRKA
jgi:hypothetical protein